mgnify:FL=1
MTNWWGLIIGSFAAALCEYLFRVHRGSYDQVFPIAMILALITNYGVFSVMQGATSLISGLLLWTFLTQAWRVAFTLLILHEQPSIGAWIGFGLVIMAQLAQRVWR